MTELRRSRTAWPGPMSVAGVGDGHSHDLPGPLVTRVRLLTWALVVVGASLAIVVALMLLLILDRSADREQEQQRLAEAFRIGICDVLDELPEGGVLDGPRGKYGCGPGRPLEEFPDDVRQRYAPPAAAPGDAGAGPGGGAAPGGAPPAPPASTARPTPPPAPAPPAPAPAPDPTPPPPTSPSDPVGEVTGTVCDLVVVIPC